jgi:2,4-dienoyl-CoA reductase-like NADH-dependent reductase (Old Yellow Enzyme family)
MKGTRAVELSKDEILGIIQAFAAGVRRAKESGYDGVQIHAAHGYLLSEFLSPRLNRRRDRWGGTAERRFRILREIAEKAREAVGDYPMLVKLSAYDDARGGMRLGEAIKIARLVQEAGFGAIEVSCGNGNFFHTVRAPRMPIDAMLRSRPGMEDLSGARKRIASWVIERKFHTYDEIFNYNAAAAKTIRQEVDIPVIAVGGIRRLADIREMLEGGSADFVSMSRPFIMEPDLVGKMRSGKAEESRCINCGVCLMGISDRPLRCYYGKAPR